MDINPLKCDEVLGKNAKQHHAMKAYWGVDV
jgi:hypothetical protein